MNIIQQLRSIPISVVTYLERNTSHTKKKKNRINVLNDYDGTRRYAKSISD